MNETHPSPRYTAEGCEQRHGEPPAGFDGARAMAPGDTIPCQRCSHIQREHNLRGCWHPDCDCPGMVRPTPTLWLVRFTTRTELDVIEP